MPVEWPFAASAADHPVDPVRPRARGDRLPVAMADFFLDEGRRLTDEERALMSALLRGLVADLSDEIIAELPAMLGAQAERHRDGVYRQLRQARLLEHSGLVELLLRRADEQQLSGHAVRGDATLNSLVADADPAISEAAMALALARGRRRDRFGRLGAEFDDVAAEDAVAAVHAIAAGIRSGLTEDADQPLVAAAQSVLARHDEGRRLEVAIATLARAMVAGDRGDDAMVRRLAEDGDASLLVGLLSRRAGIDQEDGWKLFTGGDAMLLARLAGCERAAAAQILAAFEPLSNERAAERFIDRFDAIDEGTVERHRQWLRLDPAYRKSRDALDARNG